MQELAALVRNNEVLEQQLAAARPTSQPTGSKLFFIITLMIHTYVLFFHFKDPVLLGYSVDRCDIFDKKKHFLLFQFAQNPCEVGTVPI
jgi:hypothetical protein